MTRACVHRTMTLVRTVGFLHALRLQPQASAQADEPWRRPGGAALALAARGPTWGTCATHSPGFRGHPSPALKSHAWKPCTQLNPRCASTAVRASRRRDCWRAPGLKTPRRKRGAKPPATEFKGYAPAAACFLAAASSYSHEGVHPGRQQPARTRVRHSQPGPSPSAPKPRFPGRFITPFHFA